MEDITKTGPVGLKGLRGISNVNDMTEDEFNSFLSSISNTNYNVSNASLMGQDIPLYTGYDIGSSMFDKPIYSLTDLENIQDIRAKNQPWIAKLGAGLTKGVVLAGTTFIDGTIGLLAGTSEAIAEGISGGSFNDSVSKLFNNSVSNSMAKVNEAMESLLPNYRTQEEQDNEWWQNLDTINFWADSFLKNIGFTVGAIYSGAAWTKALKAINVVKGPMGAKVSGSILSALNEGRIEANHTASGILELEYKKIEDTIRDREKQMGLPPNSGVFSEEENRLKKDAEERANSAGLTTLLGNTVLLSLDNFSTFGRIYARGFKNAREVAGNRITREALSEGVDKAAKEVANEELGKNIIREGGEYLYRDISKKRALAKGLKHALVEGNEELAQAFIADVATNMNTVDSPDAYYESLIDPNAEIQTKDFLTSVIEGFANTYGNGDRYEEFAVGFLTGALGIPTFGSRANSGADTYLGREKSIGITGGILGELNLAKAENKAGNEAVKAMNSYVKKLQDKKGHFVRSQSFTNAMDGWAEANDAFEYKNAEDNNDFTAIANFAAVGKLDDLKEMVNQDFENISDEELEEIATMTSPIGGGGWRNLDGSLMSSSEEGRRKMRKELIKKRDKILSEIDKYEESIADIKGFTNNSLSNDQANELAWLNWKVGIFTDRYKNIKEDNRVFLSKLQKGIADFKSGSKDVLDMTTGEGKNISKAFDVAEEFIEKLQSADSPLQLASWLNANPKLIEFLEEVGYPIIEDKVGIEASEFDRSIRDLKDAVRLAKAANSFNKRYKEFKASPSKIEKNRKKIDKKKEKIVNKTNTLNLVEEINNSSVSALVNQSNKGDINLDEIEGLFSEEDTEFINNKGKIEEAKAIIQETSRAIKEIDKLGEDVDEQTKQDAKKLIKNSEKVSNSEDELFDLSTISYNDLNALYDESMSNLTDEQITDILSYRLDEAKSLVERIKSEMLIQDDELDKYTPVRSITLEEVIGDTGRDTTSEVLSENERVKQEEENKRKEESKKEKRNKIKDLFNEAREQVDPKELPLFNTLIEYLIDLINIDLEDGNITTEDVIALKKQLIEYYSYKEAKRILPTLDEYLGAYIASKMGTQTESTPDTTQDTDYIATPVIYKNDLIEQISESAEIEPVENILPPSYQYWKPSMAYLPFGRLYTKGDMTPFYKKARGTGLFTEAQLKRIELLGKKFEENNVFGLIDSGAVQVNDVVKFVIDSDFNTDEEIVILMKDSQNRIIGDLMSSNDKSFGKQAYLPTFVKAVLDEYEQAGKPAYFESSFTSKVLKNMIGKVPYLPNYDTLNTLNEIHTDGNKDIPFMLGIAANSGKNARILATAGRTKEQGKSDIERTIIPPLSAQAGQPYLLMPTSSKKNHYIPVPFIMDTYNPNSVSDLSAAIIDVLERIPISDNSTAISIIRDLKELLSLQEVHINYAGDIVKVTIKPNGAEHQMTIYNGSKNTSNIVEQISLGLQGQPFQVSRKYINSTYKGKDYNRMIGEVARTNLPIGATHTVSDWFVINPVDISGGNVKSKAPKTTGFNPYSAKTDTIEVQYKGMSLSVDTQTWEVSDGTKVYTGAKADIISAYAYGQYTNKNMTAPYDSPKGYFDPVEMKFIAKPEVVERSLGAELLDSTQAKKEDVSYWILNKSGNSYSMQKDIEYLRKNNRDEYDKINNIRTANNKQVLEVFFEAKEKNALYPKEYKELIEALKGTSLENKVDSWFTPVVGIEQPSVQAETTVSNTELAKKAGLLNNRVREALWEKLTPEQQSIILNKKGPKQKQWMDALEAAWTPNGFDEIKLKGSVDSLLGRKGLYRKTEDTLEVWNEEKELKWLSKVLPNLSNEEHLRITNGLIAISESNNPEFAYGKFQNGIITISNVAASGTTYHEAFHAVVHTLLNTEEYQKLLDSAIERWGDIDGVHLEENLAEDFRKFVQSEEYWYDNLDGKNYGKIRKTLAILYHKLKNLIKELSGKTPYMNRLYYSINRGKFSNRRVNTSDVTRFSTSAYSIEYFQEDIDSTVNNPYIYKNRISKNNAWGKKVDYWKERGFLIKGYYNTSTKNWTVASFKYMGNNQETSYNRIEQHYRDKMMYNNLTQEDKEYLRDKGVTIEEYNKMSQLEKEILFKCKY